MGGQVVLTRQRRESSSGCPLASPSLMKTGTLESQIITSMKVENWNTAWSSGTGMGRVLSGMTLLVLLKHSLSVKCKKSRYFLCVSGVKSEVQLAQHTL